MKALKGLLLVVGLVIFFALPCYTGEYTIFGPSRHDRGTGKPVAESGTFTSPVTGSDFTLKLHNGDDQGGSRVSSAAITLNGSQILGPSDFNQQVGLLERKVSLGSSNDFSVLLSSAPGSFLDLTITGVDNVPPRISITDPQSGSATEAEKISISGTVKDETPVTVTVNGIPAVLNGESFAVSGIPLEVGNNTITATATDLGKNVSTSTITVTRTVPRPRIEPQPQGSFGSKYEDLIPSDATIKSYDPKRFSLVTGAVKEMKGLPLQGVTVSVGASSCVECHGQKYGTVKTDAEGRFTIPVEGGGTLSVVFRKDGLITSHRQVYVPWNDIAVAETVQMLPYDTASTTVTFDGNPQTVVVHRSTQTSDEFGSRSATIVFNGDNKAYAVDAGGNVIRKLDSITTRATEFTTPQSMPAALPPASAYTFCSEFSVDGVERVRFEKPVTAWVNNFLGFKVGSAVPVGYYDRDRGVWVPSDNGKVVRLLDMNGDGVVDALDATGDNLPDDLNGNGFFSDEVQGLNDPAKYPPNVTFWRFSVIHFTPWDCNWPYGPPSDATPPNPSGEPDVDQQLNENDDCQSAINSTVEDRSRIFHEDIPIPGTDMTLHYASNRVKGYISNIVVPASGATVPSSLKSIIVNVTVAGRVFETTLPPLPNQKAEFIWDGLDQLGREVAGTTTAKISIGFVYGTVYTNPSGFDRAFAQAGSTFTGVMARQEVISWKHFEKKIDVKGLGLIAEGWSLSDHH